MQVEVRHAVRGSRAERLPLGDFIERCAPYFAAFGGSGCLKHHPNQHPPREAMNRPNLSADPDEPYAHQNQTGD
jgi:hypothetical protein